MQAAPRSFCHGQTVRGRPRCLGGASQGPCWVAGPSQASLREPESQVQWGCQNPEGLGEPRQRRLIHTGGQLGLSRSRAGVGGSVTVAGTYLLALLQSLRTRVLEGPTVPGMMGSVGQHPWVASDRKAVQTGLAKRGHEPKPQKADPTWGTHGPWSLNFTGPHLPLLSVSPRGWPRSPPATGGLLWAWGDRGWQRLASHSISAGARKPSPLSAQTPAWTPAHSWTGP